jgi:hypothetical protein
MILKIASLCNKSWIIHSCKSKIQSSLKNKLLNTLHFDEQIMWTDNSLQMVKILISAKGKIEHWITLEEAEESMIL